MRQESSLRLVAASVLVLAACGGGDPFSGLESESDFGARVGGSGEGAAATRSVTEAQTLEGMTADEQVGEGSVSFFANAASTPLQIVSPVIFEERGLGDAADLYRETVERAARGEVLVPAAGFPDCVESAVGSVRFNDCQVMTETTTTTMNGVVEVVDGRIFTDIRVDATQTSTEGDTLSTSTTVTGDVAVTDTRIDGRVDVRTNANVQGGASATQISAAIYQVELEEGCAVGGDLRVGVQQKQRSGGFSRKLRAIGRAVFGPACGDVTVYARQD